MAQQLKNYNRYISVFLICVEVIIYLRLYNLHDFEVII